MQGKSKTSKLLKSLGKVVDTSSAKDTSLGDILLDPVLQSSNSEIEWEQVLPLHRKSGSKGFLDEKRSSEGEGQPKQRQRKKQLKIVSRPQKSPVSETDDSATDGCRLVSDSLKSSEDSIITNLAPLLDARLSPMYTSRAALDTQLRLFNFSSERQALLTFSQPSPADPRARTIESIATSQAVKCFGAVVGDKSCTVLPAHACKSLYLRGLPRGLRHSALGVVLGEVLAPLGFSIPPAYAHIKPEQNLRGGNLGWGSYQGSTPSAACPVTNRDGEAIITFETFQDALVAHDALVGLLLEARKEKGKPRGSGFIVPGNYSTVVVGFATPQDLKSCGSKSGVSIWVDNVDNGNWGEEKEE